MTNVSGQRQLNLPLQLCVFPLSVQQNQTAVYKSPFWAAINEETEALLSHYVLIPQMSVTVRTVLQPKIQAWGKTTTTTTSSNFFRINEVKVKEKKDYPSFSWI